MKQIEKNIIMLQNKLFDREDAREIKVCVHDEANYKHPDKADIATIEVTLSEHMEPILINLVSWVIPVDMLETHPLTKEQIEKYIEGIDGICAQKETEEIKGWAIGHKDKCNFFLYTPWYFLSDYRYVSKKDKYEIFPFKKDNQFYLYTFVMIGPQKLSQSDYMVIAEKIPSSCKDRLVHKLRSILNAETEV